MKALSRQVLRHISRGGYSPEQLEKLFSEFGREVSYETMDRMVEFTLNQVMLYFHDKKGYGQKRLGEICDYVLNQVEALDQGLITEDDVKQVLKEECDIELVVRLHER